MRRCAKLCAGKVLRKWGWPMARDPVYRQDAPGYLGMVRETQSLRVIVAQGLDGAAYYRLQAKGPVVKMTDPGWVPVAASSSPTLAKLLAKCAASAPGLRELVEGLPDDPAKAAPWLRAILDERGRAMERFGETHMRPPLV